MSGKLSEAARLYLDDFDILNEAHQEVLALFKSIWNACAAEVAPGAKHGSGLMPKDCKGRKIQGNWYYTTSGWPGMLNLYFGPSLSAVAGDPAWDACKRKRFFVRVAATGGWKYQMTSGDGRGMEAANKAAKEMGIEQLDWGNPQSLIEAWLDEINTDNPDETGRKVAEKLYEMLAIIDGLQQAIASVSATTPGDPGFPPEESESA